MNTSGESGQLFNTPVESGLRSLFVLASIKPGTCDLQRLVIYDYLLVHSGDVDGGPESLHPATPFRSGELLVRRGLIEQGLRLLLRKGLVEKTFSPQGIGFRATDLAGPFLDYLQSPYAQRCRAISQWVAQHFHTLPDNDLSGFISSNLGRWGAEFTRESSLWEEVE